MDLLKPVLVKTKYCLAAFLVTALLFSLISCASVSVPDYFSYNQGVVKTAVRGSVDGVDVSAVIFLGEKPEDGQAREIGIEYTYPESLEGIRISRDRDGKSRVIISRDGEGDGVEMDAECFPDGSLDGMLDMAQIIAYDGEISSAEHMGDGIYDVKITAEDTDLTLKTDTERRILLSVSGRYKGRRYDLKICDGD